MKNRGPKMEKTIGKKVSQRGDRKAVEKIKLNHFCSLRMFEKFGLAGI